MLKNETLKIRIKDSDKEKIREASRALNMTMTSFIFKCVMDKIKEMEETNNEAKR